MADLELTATKDEHGENFPVASHLIAARHRPVILAFYRFARAADDVADSPDLSASEKIRRLDLFEDTLLGRSDAADVARPLRAALEATGVTARHAQDLLIAFRMDATKTRYDDFADLLNYCRYSAAPVGRFVLDVHGEAATTWPANDALCASLQIINHLQDCAKDFRLIDRVYVPLDILRAHGADVSMLGAASAAPALRASLRDVAERNGAFVEQGRGLSPRVTDFRLRLETAIIARLAGKLNGWLIARDPLSQPVHLRKSGALWQAVLGASDAVLGRASQLSHPARAERS